MDNGFTIRAACITAATALVSGAVFAALIDVVVPIPVAGAPDASAEVVLAKVRSPLPAPSTLRR